MPALYESPLDMPLETAKALYRRAINRTRPTAKARPGGPLSRQKSWPLPARRIPPRRPSSRGGITTGARWAIRRRRQPRVYAAHPGPFRAGSASELRGISRLQGCRLLLSFAGALHASTGLQARISNPIRPWPRKLNP